MTVSAFPPSVSSSGERWTLPAMAQGPGGHNCLLGARERAQNERRGGEHQGHWAGMLSSRDHDPTVRAQPPTTLWRHGKDPGSAMGMGLLLEWPPRSLAAGPRCWD